MPVKEHIAPTEIKSSLNGAKVLAITFGTEDLEEELSGGLGAVRLLDKTDLSDQLIPAILLFRGRLRSDS
jgi:hypothetical protein